MKRKFKVTFFTEDFNGKKHITVFDVCSSHDLVCLLNYFCKHSPTIMECVSYE